MHLAGNPASKGAGTYVALSGADFWAESGREVKLAGTRHDACPQIRPGTRGSPSWELDVMAETLVASLTREPGRLRSAAVDADIGRVR